MVVPLRIYSKRKDDKSESNLTSGRKITRKKG